MRVRFRLAAAFSVAALVFGSAYAVVTSDAFVRRMVRSVLGRTFRGPAHFTSASFSLRDGLVVHGLEVLDPTDPTGPPAVVVDRFRALFAFFPLEDGPRVTEVVLERPSGRIRRLADGSLSVGSLLAHVPESDGATSMPRAIRIEAATISFDDPSIVAGGPVTLERTNVRLTPTGDAWQIDLTATSKDLGTVVCRAFAAPGGTVTADVTLPSLPVGPDLFSRLKVPGVAAIAAVGGWGTVSAHAEMAYRGGQAVELDARVGLAGLEATVRIPESAPDVPAPEPVHVRVARGVAELRGAAIEVTGLEVVALGATATCARGTLSGVGTANAGVDAEFSVEGLAVSPALTRHLPAAARDVIDAYGLAGTVAATVALRGPLAAPLLTVDASTSDGTVCYEGYPDKDGRRSGFPWKVTDVEATASFDGKRLRFDAAGRHGLARAHAAGGLDWSTGDEIPEVTIEVDDVPLDADLRAAFQDRAEQSFDRWAPSGTAARVVIRVLRDPHADGPHGQATEVDLHLDGRASMCPALLPMTLSEVRGTVRVLAPQRGDHRAERVILEGVTAQGEGLDLTVDGLVDTDREVAEDDLVVTARVADLGGSVREAILASEEFIPVNVKRLLVDLGARGPVAVRAEVAGDADRRRDLVTFDLAGASVSGYRDVPFAADAITGRIVVDRDEARIEDLSALSLGTTIRGAGRLLGLSGDVESDVRIEAANLPLGPPLRRALGPIASHAAAFWEKLRPVGEAGTLGTRADLVLVLRPSKDPTPAEIWLTKIRGPLLPLGLELDTRGGEFHYDGREATLRLTASVGAAEIDLKRAHLDVQTGRLDASADLRGLRFPEDVDGLFSPDTGVKLRDLFPGRNLDWAGLDLTYVPDRETVELAGALRIHPRSPRRKRAAPEDDGLGVAGDLAVSRMTLQFLPDLPVSFDATVNASGLRIRPGIAIEDFWGPLSMAGQIGPDGVEMTTRTVGARLLVEEFPITEASIDATVSAAGPRIEASGIFHGGRLTGRLTPGRPGVKYAGQLHLRDADLASIAGEKAGVRGKVGGDANFNNTTGKIEDLRGSAELWIKDGDLGRFPLVSAILNLVPGAGDLTEASLTSNVKGPSLAVRDLVIRGPVLKVTGDKGWLDFDGRLDIEMSAFWGVPFASLPLRATGTIRKPEVRVQLIGGSAPHEQNVAPSPPPVGGDAGSDGSSEP